MFWLPIITIHARIRAIIGQRMEHGATDELDRNLMALIEAQERVERAGWFS